MTRTCSACLLRASHVSRSPYGAILAGLAVWLILICVSPASLLAGDDDPYEQEVISLYERFVAAQNARDVPAVRALLSPEPTFQWVSDGNVFWGRDLMLERMALFQKSPIWRVEPDRQSRRFVRLSAGTAYLYQPLTLVIGSETSPSRLHFLVNVICVRDGRGWRIAGLFTTLKKSS